MSLHPCRGCGYQVDISAQACPKCGATDPAKKISRQKREARSFLLQLMIGLCLLGSTGWVVWHEVVPIVKAIVIKPSLSNHNTE